MSEPFVGQITAVAFNFVPVGWLPCDGAVLPIGQYGELYSVIGTTYGGDGQSTFAVPNLQGRVALDAGQNPALPPYSVGQVAGDDSLTLLATQIGAHTHQLRASGKQGTKATPDATSTIGVNAQQAAFMYGPPPASQSLAAGEIEHSSGGSQPHENRQPYLVINYIICCNGIYPPRP